MLCLQTAAVFPCHASQTPVLIVHPHRVAMDTVLRPCAYESDRHFGKSSKIVSDIWFVSINVI